MNNEKGVKMDAIECIKTRKSIRKFMPESVPPDILFKVLDAAVWSPSYKNSQPWELVIVSGKRKEGLTQLLTGLLEKGTIPQPDLSEPESWPSEIAARIKESQLIRSAHFGIDLTDPMLLKKSKKANFNFYGAPHGVFLFQEASLTEWSIFDMGLFAQSLMLAAHAYGLGTVPQAFLTDYSKAVKNFLDIPDSKKLVLGISIGYPDLNDKTNNYRSTRIDSRDIVNWIE